MAAAVPTLPFVALQAHKPSAPHEILAATTAIASSPAPIVPTTGGGGEGGLNATVATTMTRSSSSVSLHPPRSVSSDISHLRSASSSTGATGGGGGAGVGISGNGTSFSAGGRPLSVGMLRSSTAPVPQHHNPSTTATTPPTTTTATATSTYSGLPSASTNLSFPTNTSIPTTVQTRTLHPQVHYIFENDPLETEILESIPKSQCITMDFDPRSGVIKNVESYLTHLQVMDVRLVQSFGQEGQQGQQGQAQRVTSSGSPGSLSSPSASASGARAETGSGAGAGAVSSSSSASSLKATTTASGSGGGGGGGPADDNRTHLITSPPQSHPSTSSPSSSSSGALTVGGTLLARNNPLSSSTLQSSFKTSRRSTDKGTRGDASVSDDKSTSPAMATTATTMVTKDWTLVIDAVELDRRDQESDSQLLEQSMISSLDTDSIPEDYILHCDALMKSFSVRNSLLRKVIDYANTTTSPTGTPP